MSKQNIFDNEVFFQGYKAIRDREVNANKLFEIPALFSLIPNLKNKNILDLGCGYGENCQKFIELGANSVIGIDISEKMLAVAKVDHRHPKIQYLHLSMESMDQIDKKFDLIVCSLAIHYVENFDNLIRTVYNNLEDGGYFIFSQEHPLNTCHANGNRWTHDDDGNKLFVNLSNYGVEGEKETVWLIDGVKKYHRTFSTIINGLVRTGFKIEEILEPLPTDEIVAQYPQYLDLFHKPDFLLVKCQKVENMH